MSKLDYFAELGTELDCESYRWLVDNHSKIAEAVETAVLRGATPDSIRRYVLEWLGPERNGLAQRCQSAARFLEASK